MQAPQQLAVVEAALYRPVHGRQWPEEDVSLHPERILNPKFRNQLTPPSHEPDDYEADRHRRRPDRYRGRPVLRRSRRQE